MKKVAATRGQKLIAEFRRDEGEARMSTSGAMDCFNCCGCLLSAGLRTCAAMGASFRGTFAKNTANAERRKRFRQRAGPRPERATRNKMTAVTRRIRATAM